jgi:hypothetical protein
MRPTLLLTLCYWATAILLATLTPRPDWIDLRWPIAIYLFAVPVTILLWIVAIGAHFLRPAMSRWNFTLIGVALPVVYAVLAWGAGHWLSEHHAQRLEEQLHAAALTAFDDGPLVDAKGPIGVRLRYRVLYPLGLDLDESHGAFAQLSTTPSHGALVMIRRTVSPPVAGHFKPGTYEFTEDFVPAFLPPAWSGPPDRTATSHCFRWSANTSRDEILSAAAESPAVAIYLAHIPIQRSTIHAYQLGDFYATAVEEGAVDCPA